tara:strand:+ start:7189 stop:8079 length:891 start_codon:yes stop_codon:yes gene_type:complete
MKICLENVNLGSNSGPNSFAQKLKNQFNILGCEVTDLRISDISLCFIESHRKNINSMPTFQRLDGIYFNTQENYDIKNSNILRTYRHSSGVIFQSTFNKDLIFRWFGPHKNYRVIHNGADLELIDQVSPIDEFSQNYDNIWVCASSWRPHKRLSENIRYFLEHSGARDCLLVAGSTNEEPIKHPRIKYLGHLNQRQLISIYKASKYFIHLAWLDHCPNVVVDARACGCRVICSSSGGTKEIAGPNAIIIEEEEWDFSPIDLYSPKVLNFNNKLDNSYDSCYNMHNVAKEYLNFVTE